MGLDMYLSKKTFVRNYRDDGGYQVQVTKDGQPTDIDPKRIAYVVEEVGYWRKANAIHRWFVDNVQSGEDDCKEYYVNGQQLKELLTDCQQVLEAPSLAKEILPTTSGFFFGCIEYDDGYFDDLRQTVEIIQKCLNGDNKSADYYYQASW